MTRALTVADVRSLLRLHRRRLDGAADELRRILTEERDALRLLFGPDVVELLGDASDASIERLARIIDANGVERTRSTRERAERLALRFATGCRRCSGGIVPPLPWLEELVRNGGFATLAFRIDDEGDRGIERALLVALLRELRSVEVTEAVITTNGDLRVAYRKQRMRGGITLRAAPVGAARDALIVDLGMLSLCIAPRDAPIPLTDSRRPTSAPCERTLGAVRL